MKFISDFIEYISNPYSAAVAILTIFLMLVAIYVMKLKEHQENNEN